MKKIKIIKVKAHAEGWALFRGIKYDFSCVDNIIAEMLEEGWTFSGYVPNIIRSIGGMETISLIFQKE